MAQLLSWSDEEPAQVQSLSDTQLAQVQSYFVILPCLVQSWSDTQQLAQVQSVL